MIARYLRPAQSRWCVRPGETVRCGALIGTGRVRTHAAFAGTIATVAGDTLELVVADTAQAPSLEPLDTQSPRADLLERIEHAGIVGLGGGGYPTHLKLAEALRASVEKLVINAVECEPGVRCDAALCEQFEQEVVQGIEALKHLLDAEVHIVQGAATCPSRQTWQTHTLKADTPAGAERHLCRSIFGITLAPAERPVHHGIVVVNVGTAHAIARALQGWPLINRMVTVHGSNRWLAVGTPIPALLDGESFLVGGRLSGARVGSDAAIDKTTNAVEPAPARLAATPCINCGACDAVCPESLPVAQLARLPRRSVDTAQRLCADRCIECGLCTPACPSHIDVLDILRQHRKDVRLAVQEQQAAAMAGNRFAAREHRRAAQNARREARRQERLQRRQRNG